MTAQPVVVVTGASGFVGGHVSRLLAAEGFHVRALVRRIDSVAALRLRSSGITVHQGDVRDREQVTAAMAGASAVVHAAMPTRVVRRSEVWKTGVEGTACVARAAGACSVARVVHISSYSVYYGVLGRPCREDAELRPCGDLYADAKLAAERRLLSIEPGAVVLRAPIVYGPGSWHWTERPYAVARRRRLWLPAGGEFPVACTHVASLARAVASAVSTSAPPGVYNVFDGIVTYASLMQPVADAAGCGTRAVPVGLLAAGARLFDLALHEAGLWAPVSPVALRFLVDGFRYGPERAERAMTLLGWRPEYTVADGIARTVRWLAGDGAGHTASADESYGFRSG